MVFALSQPEDVDINEILFRPTSQEFCAEGYLKQQDRSQNQVVEGDCFDLLSALAS